MFESATPGLAFVDINMPEKDGFATTKEALNINPYLKIIGISSFERIDFVKNWMGNILRIGE